MSATVVGTSALPAAAQTAEETTTAEHAIEVPIESLLVVAGVAAVGAFVGALLANLLWSRQMSDQSQQSRPAPENPRQGGPAQQQPRGQHHESRGAANPQRGPETQQGGAHQPEQSGTRQHE